MEVAQGRISGRYREEDSGERVAHDHPDHIPYYREGGIQLVSYRGALPPDTGYDLWGVEWQKDVDEFLPYPVGHPIESPGDLADYVFPDLTLVGPRHGLDGPLDTEENLVVGCHYCALLERLCSLCGTENALVWTLEHTDAVAQFLDRLADWHVEIAEQFMGLGVEAGRVSDDYGTQQSLLLSPDLWRIAVRPALARVVGFYKARGRLVFLHSCGHIKTIMNDLAGLGIDVFNIQTATNDLAALKREYQGQITIMGGIDTQDTMTRGTPEIVRQHVKKAIGALGKGGGLILEPDQRIRMPDENISALIQAAREFGAYR